MNSDNRFNEIIQDEKILAIFIFLNIINIYADELEKECLNSKDRNLLSFSKDILIFTLAVTLIIYIYFAINNYKDLVNNYGSDDEYLFKVRYIGSIFIVVGLVCSLYFRINTRNTGDIDLSEGF